MEETISYFGKTYQIEIEKDGDFFVASVKDLCQFKYGETELIATQRLKETLKNFETHHIGKNVEEFLPINKKILTKFWD